MTDFDIPSKTPTWDDWQKDWATDLPATGAISPETLAVLEPLPFLIKGRDAQKPPAGDWHTWLFLGGRGAGKTRAGAEWIRFCALFGGFERIALVGPTHADVREVMIEGPSGLRALEWENSGYSAPRYESTRRRLVWENGATAHVFSAEEPERLRGPQFHAAWCDEIGAWKNAKNVWDMLQMGMRLGATPRLIATTTPRPTPLLKQLLARADDEDSGVVLTRSSSFDNANNLAAGFLSQIKANYAGSVLGRQELDGEMVEDFAGALWTRADLESARDLPQWSPFDRIIVAIDPPVTSGKSADACGIIAAGRWVDAGGASHGVLLADRTSQGDAPLDWARRAISLAETLHANAIIVEDNQGGEMVTLTLKTAGCTLPIERVHAVQSKRVRAVPIAALYNAGRISHRGFFAKLEDEMAQFGSEGWRGSPNRLDALVWAMRHLLLTNTSVPNLRRL